MIPNVRNPSLRGPNLSIFSHLIMIDEKIREAVETTTSYADAIRHLNKEPNGGNYRWLKVHIKRLGLSTDHFLSRSEISAKGHRDHPREPIYKISHEDLFSKESTCYSTKTIKKRLVKSQAITYECSVCKIKDWQEKAISLHLDHINGDPLDHRIENLRLLCPNCHSQTNTYCSRNRKGKVPAPPTLCRECQSPISRGAIKCRGCRSKPKQLAEKIPIIRKTKIVYPPTEQLVELCKEHGFCEIGRRLGVSDNAIRRYLARRGY